jgi:hypothetical protein
MPALAQICQVGSVDTLGCRKRIQAEYVNDSQGKYRLCSHVACPFCDAELEVISSSGCLIRLAFLRVLESNDGRI